MKNRFNEISVSIVLACMVFALPSSSEAVYSVLWDTSHGIYSDYHPDTSGQYKDLASHLISNDFTVNTTDSGFTSASLSGVDVAVVSVMSAWDSAYSTAEVDALTTFVNNGGGLLIMSEYQAAPNANIAAVASAFGISLEVSDLSPYSVDITNLAGHSVFDMIEAVNTVHFYAGSELGVSGDAYGIAWQDITGKIAIAANESYGFGRVIVLGDSTLWLSNGSNEFGMVDNAAFALNTFSHLAVPEPATIILFGAGAVIFAGKRRTK